jgi:hypothetical protein
MDLEATRFLLSLNKSDCTHIVRWLDRLRDAPFSTGHATFRDGTDRDIQVSNTGKFLVSHWTDHPVKTVRVVKIEKAYSN